MNEEDEGTKASIIRTMADIRRSKQAIDLAIKLYENNKPFDHNKTKAIHQLVDWARMTLIDVVDEIDGY